MSITLALTCKMLSIMKNALFPLLLLSQAGYGAAASPAYPTAPELSFLYTAYVKCEGTLMESRGPHGIRKAIPIVGGNFTGPHLSGSVPSLGHRYHWLILHQGKFSMSVLTGD